MMLICAGALVAGLLMAPVLPFLPFAASLTLAVVIGIGLSFARGMPFGETFLPALTILVACQVGYGVGLIVMAAVGKVWQPRRRWRAPETSSTPVKRLRPK